MQEISAGDAFKTAPRIGRMRFARILRDAGSPWAGEAHDLYDLIAGNGHDPAVWLAIAGREHRYGAERESVLHRNRTNSWTNARSVRSPGMPHEIIHDAVRGGPYVRYRSAADSLRDGMARVDDPEYVYRQRNATSINDVLRIWTESDGDGYIAYVVARMNEWLGVHEYARIFPRLVDVRDQLAGRAREEGVSSGPHARVALAGKHGLVVHYSGPAVVNRAATLVVLQSEASYHVAKNWATAGNAAIYGDGLMYHVAIGDSGTVYLCRDLESALWHCGDRDWNQHALSVHLPLGGEQRATAAQLNALHDVAERWLAFSGGEVDDVRGHQEITPTACPGTLMDDFVYPFRDGERAGASGHYFAETGHYVGGAFWEYWRDRGGLAIFGYPLSAERRERTEDGSTRTVQYFERAVFEWHPENDPDYQVLLRRLGAGPLASR